MMDASVGRTHGKGTTACNPLALCVVFDNYMAQRAPRSLDYRSHVLSRLFVAPLLIFFGGHFKYSSACLW
jgi:hypothetical protein